MHSLPYIQRGRSGGGKSFVMHFTRTLVRHASDVVALKVGWLTNFKMLVPVGGDLEWCGVGVCCGAMGLSCAKATWTSDHLTLLSVESLPVSSKCKVTTRCAMTRRSSKRGGRQGCTTRGVLFLRCTQERPKEVTGQSSATGTSVSLPSCPRGAPWQHEATQQINELSSSMYNVLMTQRGPSSLRHRRRHWQQSALLW